VVRKLAFRIGIVLASSLVLLSLLELGVALSGFEYPPADSPLDLVDPNMRVEGRLLHESSVRQIWRPRPGATIPWGHNDRVNDDGFRGPLVPVARTPGVLRIATMGDSSTFGHSVAWEETYSAQLAAQLAAEGVRCEVIDAGVVGSSIRQGLERYEEQVSRYKPDIVIAAFGAVIDHVEAPGGIDDDALIRQNVLAHRGLRIIAQRWRRDLRSLHLLAWCLDELRGGRARMRGEAHDREMLRSHLVTTMGTVDWKGVRRVSPDQFEQDLLLLRDQVARDGGRMILLSMPHRGVVEIQSPVVLEYNKRILAVGERKHIPVVDGRGAFSQAIRDQHTIPDLMVDNFHPSPIGHEYLARALCAEILRTVPGSFSRPRRS